MQESHSARSHKHRVERADVCRSVEHYRYREGSSLFQTLMRTQTEHARRSFTLGSAPTLSRSALLANVHAISSYYNGGQAH